jgi:hypothetical protein
MRALATAGVAMALMATGQANASPAGSASEGGVVAIQTESALYMENPWSPYDWLLVDYADDYAWADWNANGSRPEVFAVASNRTVWHAWPGGGGWKLVPGNKGADDIINGTDSQGRRAWWWSGTTRNISVWAANGGEFWCTSDPGSGWTGVWRDC